ncbi:hypothetical protein EVAR_81723_1 [Eumeta japonica]|uniref:Uncharacterized protein n=1 Tax=Eumeta variegata TaxID=151549 RepID=A0A4C1UH86_EUMVA|nr:hypothetical protein EVAR_81723_1 [Eumeta japonica]
MGCLMEGDRADGGGGEGEELDHQNSHSLDEIRQQKLLINSHVLSPRSVATSCRRPSNLAPVPRNTQPTSVASFLWFCFVQIEAGMGSGIGIESETEWRIKNGTKIRIESEIRTEIKNETVVECGDDIRTKKCD